VYRFSGSFRVRVLRFIVGEANSLVAQVHDRMPVMLMPDDYDLWLDPATQIDEVRIMLKPFDAKLMEAYEVKRTVNSVKNDTEECIKPLVV
jgi:putative SOS response-associated peptidase YedK